MKTLICNCGELILIDEINFAHLSKFRWSCKSNGAVYNEFLAPIANCVKYRPKDKFIWDHINRNNHDNQVSNLRLATQQQNSFNSTIKSSNTSGLIGVSWDRSKEKWSASIRIDGKKTFIGRFASKEEAAAAYNQVVLQTRGEFAVLNKGINLVVDLPTSRRKPKLTQAMADEIRLKLTQGRTVACLATKYMVSIRTIYLIQANEIWSPLHEPSQSKQ